MKKKIHSLFFKIYIRLSQKRFYRLKYLFQRHRSSDMLVVCFSGFAGGNSARYNYVQTLQTQRINKLFILDDFGYNRQGSYYLGENGDWYLPEMVVGLIKKIQTKNNIRHLIMVGSSKGASAALFYATKMNADFCIIGAPQYFIGNYLNTDDHLSILEGIMGDKSSDSIQKLNNVMHDCLRLSYGRKPKVYIHYSPMEHTYPEHIADMVHDMKMNGYTVEEDADYDYVDHGQVAKYFPSYLLNVLKKLSKA